MGTPKSRGRGKKPVVRSAKQQRGRQQGHNTGKDAWKSNFKILDDQPGPGQKGQYPRAGEPSGSTPGEVRGHPGGRKGQAMGGKRGTARSRRMQKRFTG